jgi:hypothetical protein
MVGEDIINLRGFNNCYFLFIPLEMNHSDVFRGWEDYHTVSVHHTYYWTFILIFELDYFSLASKITLTNVSKFAAHSTNEASKIRRFVLVRDHINTLKFRSTQNILVILDSLVVKLNLVQAFDENFEIVWTTDDWSGVA